MIFLKVMSNRRRAVSMLRFSQHFSDISECIIQTMIRCNYICFFHKCMLSEINILVHWLPLILKDSFIGNTFSEQRNRFVCQSLSFKSSFSSFLEQGKCTITNAEHTVGWILRLLLVPSGKFSYVHNWKSKVKAECSGADFSRWNCVKKLILSL